MFPDFVRWPVYAPFNVDFSPAIDVSRLSVGVCEGRRRKYVQNMFLTEAFLTDAIMFAGCVDLSDRFTKFGTMRFGQAYVGHCFWGHDEKTRRYSVDFAFWKYDWTHAPTCKEENHDAEFWRK